MPARPALVVVLLAALALTGCGSDDKDTTGSTSSDKVAVKAGDTTCDVAKTEFEAGKIEFDVENTGKDVTEVYVYGKGSSGKFDKVIGEVENIAPGTSRDFEVDVTAGDYEVACKPGQKGDGIRTGIEVEGDGGSSEAAYDREVEVVATDFAFTGLSGFTGKAGEKIELKLENKSSSTTHELEVFGPDGKEVGEVAPVAPGETGEAIVELTSAGTYTYECGIGNHAEQGMKGSFTVA